MYWLFLLKSKFNPWFCLDSNSKLCTTLDTDDGQILKVFKQISFYLLTILFHNLQNIS